MATASTGSRNSALHDRRQLLIGKQTKTDALDARLLFEREHLSLKGGFLQRPPVNALRRRRWDIVCSIW